MSLVLKDNYLVQKRNIVNALRSHDMTIQELRFFSIYLAKINKDDLSTRKVRFLLKDFQKIMGFGRLNNAQLVETTTRLLQKVVNVPNENGGYTGFQLFKECTVDCDKAGELFVEFDAHDKALPLMFEFKDNYFSYRLWNALSLRSPNQIRMYEILKQYETIGERIISVVELRELLGVRKKEYPQWERFRVRVLDACQAALAENTDITYTYQPHGAKGPGGKVLTLKFIIRKNDSHIPQSIETQELMGLPFYQDKHQEHSKPEAHKAAPTKHDKAIELLSDACDNEFGPSQVQLLLDLVVQVVPYGATGMGIEHHDYLFRKYNELNYQAGKSKVLDRFEYLRAMIKTDIK